MVPTGPTEIMFATNRFNCVSVALPVEKNSGMDRYGPTNLTATVLGGIVHSGMA
jgi:hypothetical protein